MDRSAPKDLIVLVAAFATAGPLHLARPGLFEPIVPRRLPAKRALVYASGAAELVCAAALVAPSTRRVAGLASAVLLVAIFPANVSMAIQVCRSRGPLARVLVCARLPLQVPLVRTAWRAWRD